MGLRERLLKMPAELLKKVAPEQLPERTGKVHDFTRLYWGHNFEARTLEGTDVLKGWVWCTPGPRAGDEFIWKSAGGMRRGLVLESVWSSNVDDMYQVTVKVIGREETGDA